jgi:hypothetical protein
LEKLLALPAPKLHKNQSSRKAGDLTLMRKQLAIGRPQSGIVVVDEIQRLPELIFLISERL